MQIELAKGARCRYDRLWVIFEREVKGDVRVSAYLRDGCHVDFLRVHDVSIIREISHLLESTTSQYSIYSDVYNTHLRKIVSASSSVSPRMIVLTGS